MAQGKQAKVLTEAEIKRVKRHIAAHSKAPTRDTVALLFSHLAGLRVGEIASLRWSMVLDASGEVGECLELPDKATKGKCSGRIIPLSAELLEAVRAWYDEDGRQRQRDDAIMQGQRGA